MRTFLILLCVLLIEMGIMGAQAPPPAPRFQRPCHILVHRGRKSHARKTAIKIAINLLFRRFSRVFLEISKQSVLDNLYQYYKHFNALP